MTGSEPLLQDEERTILETLARGENLDAKRAAALLAIDAGSTQTAAAETAGLSSGQVAYAVRKFRSQRLLAFPDAIAAMSKPTPVGTAPDATAAAAAEAEPIAVEEEPTPPSPAQRSRRINQLLQELDRLAAELRSATPSGDQSAYSPLRLLQLVRDNISQYTPDIQLHILEQFEDMSREDLMDLETWKGIAYMIAYSAQFQATQTRAQLSEKVPAPLKPEVLLRDVKDRIGRFTPEIAKEMASNFESATREDLMDPEMWKGLAYMIGYSAQFQAGRARDRLNEQMPVPLKPDTLFHFVKSTLDKVTPDVAKQIVASFEDATVEDLLDPDTWKGVWYMLNYSLQFQAQQMKTRLRGEAQTTETE